MTTSLERWRHGNVVVLFGFQTPEEHAQWAGMLSYLLRGLGQKPSRLRVASLGNTSIVAGVSGLVHAWRQPKITGGHIASANRANQLTEPEAAPRLRGAGQRQKQAHFFLRVTQLGKAFFDSLLFGLKPFKQVQKAVDDHAVGRGEHRRRAIAARYGRRVGWEQKQATCSGCGSRRAASDPPNQALTLVP